MIKKIIYINYQPLNVKYYHDYYLKECINNKFEVEYWDLSKIYFPDTNFINENQFNIVLRNIISLSEIKTLIKNNNIHSTVFITNITYEFRVWKLFRILTQQKCKLIFFARGMIPMPQDSSGLNLHRLIKVLSYKRLTSFLKNKISVLLKSLKYIKTYDIVFRAGSQGGFTIGYGSHYDIKSSDIIDINYFDYDKFLNVSQNEPLQLVSGKYCIFLDQDLAFHSDFSLVISNNVNPKAYYKELNRYFQFIELKYKLKVVIAAHPKSTHYKMNNPFDGRQIIFDKTCELVRDASFTLTHHSTAISFPILFSKPIVFLNSDEIKKNMPFEYNLTIHLGKILNCEVVDYDYIKNYKDLTFEVDKEKYDTYISQYLSSKTTLRIYSSQIFIEKLKEI